MRRHGTSKSAAIPVRKPMGFPERVVGMIVVLFAVLIFALSDEYPRQLPVGLLSAVLVLSLLAYRRPEDVNRASELSNEEQKASRPLDELESDLRPKDEAGMVNPVVIRLECEDVINGTDTRDISEIKLGLGSPTNVFEAELTPELSTEMPTVPCPLDKVEVDVPVTEAVVVAMPAETRRRYKDAIAEIGARHICKFELGLSPLVFGPAAEVMPIIDACLPADSLCDVTARSREIILFGRAKYAALSSKCSQKRFVKAVMDAHDSMRVERKLDKLGVSYDIFYGTLTGKNPSLEARLAIPMPVDAYAQLTLL